MEPARMEEVQWLMEPMDMSVREPARTVAQVGRVKGSERTCELWPRSDETMKLHRLLHIHHRSISNRVRVHTALLAWH